MNILMSYFIVCSCSAVLPLTYGRKFHSKNWYAEHKSGILKEDSKYKSKNILDIYPEDININYPTKNQHLLKLTVDVPEKIKSNLVSKGNPINRLPNSDYKGQNRKSLSMKVGKHIVRVKSALLSKRVEAKQSEEDGYKISLNPKFSHTIEILPIDKNNLETEHKPKNSDWHKTKILLEPEETYVKPQAGDDEGNYVKNEYNPKSSDFVSSESFFGREESITSESVETELVTTESVLDREELIKTENVLETEHVTTESALDREELIKTENVLETEHVTTESALDREKLEKTENVFETEFVPTESVVDREDLIKTENVLGTEFVTTESALDREESISTSVSLETEHATEQTDIELLAGSGDQESVFERKLNDEFEGSGEESSTRIFENKDADRSGKVLGFFSPQTTAPPNCTTPKGEPGQCRQIRQCLLSDALNNFNVFLQHLCLIRGVLVGICCPNNPVIEISNPDENSTRDVSETDIKQPPEGCGLNTKTRIVGGSISGAHEWTWMVALLRRNRFYCGGVIINNWYILTAAHCVLGINLKDLSVRLGEYDFNKHNRHQEDISVSEIKRHAQFVTLTFQHDIALLKLQRSIRYSKFVGSICLPTQKARDYSDVNGTVVGWGTVSFGGAASPVLRQVTVPVWKNEVCDRTYVLENISDAFMCAGSPEKGEDACQGDSGGPLMTLNERGRWEVIGLVSWGRRCGDPTYPGVYTRVTTYLDWINQNSN